MDTTREHILHKAFMLFILHGYDGMSMLSLQEQTKLSRGALYHHFKSKSQLFFEVIDTYYIAKPTTTSKPLEINSLYAFYHGYFEHTVNVFKMLRASMSEINPENDISFFTLGLDAMKKYPGFRDKIRDINNEVHKIWVNVVKTARTNGEIQSGMTDDQIASFFIYLSEGIGTRHTLEGRGMIANDELIRLWDSFYFVIKK